MSQPVVYSITDVQAFRERWVACLQWEKTTGPVTFYKMYGNHYVRSRSSLTRKRVLKDKAFARTREYAAVLKKAAQLAAPVYKSLTEDWRCLDLYRKLVGTAAKWLLHAGREAITIQQGLKEELNTWGYRTEWPQWENNLPPNLAAWKKTIEETDTIPQQKRQRIIPEHSCSLDYRQVLTHLYLSSLQQRRMQLRCLSSRRKKQPIQSKHPQWLEDHPIAYLPPG